MDDIYCFEGIKRFFKKLFNLSDNKCSYGGGFNETFNETFNGMPEHEYEYNNASYNTSYVHLNSVIKSEIIE